MLLTQILINDNKNEKVLFDLYIDGKKQMKRISFKILERDDNDQYGRAKTKPLPYGCIKKKGNPPTLLEFNRILDGGYYWTLVDIKFPDINPKHCYLMNYICQYLKKNKKRNHSSNLPFNF